MLPDTLLQDVVSLCESAGGAIMEIYTNASGFDVTHKADNSPVTAADMAAQAVLAPGLAALLADVPVLSEESAIPSYDLRRQWQRYWLIDPLDGTKEFINRNHEFTVNVALIENGVPVLGVVYVPALNIAYTGSKNTGAQKYSGGKIESIHVRTIASRVRAGLPVEIVASRRHGTDAVNLLVASMRKHFHQVSTKSMGSSLKLCLVAEGEADLYPRLAPTCEWDTAAAQAVVEAAGGTVYTSSFKLMRYNRKAELLNPDFYVVGDADYDWASLLPRV